MYYRIDKFAVPAHSRTKFLERVETTNVFLRNQDGYVRDHILEQEAPHGSNIITIMEWQNSDVVKRVSADVKAMYAEVGFDPHTFMQQLGVVGEFGMYEPV